jgi:hypothetical protein
MIKSNIGQGPLPPLTAAGILALSDDLGADLMAVQASTSASTKLKQDIQTRIEQLQALLQAFAQDIDSGADVPSWTADVAPLFLQLNPLLQQALPGQLDLGSCSYDQGCIETTQGHCTSLGGIFVLGGNCPMGP